MNESPFIGPRRPPVPTPEATIERMRNALLRCGWTLNALRGTHETLERGDVVAYLSAKALTWSIQPIITTSIPYVCMVGRTMVEVVEEYFHDDLSKEEQQLLDIVIGCVRANAPCQLDNGG